MNVVILSFLLTQAPVSAGSAAAPPPDCARLLPLETRLPGIEPLCEGQSALERGRRGSGEARRAEWQTAAELLLRASGLLQSSEHRRYAFEALATIYDPAHLNEPAGHERALRTLIAIETGSPAPLIRLAKFLEGQGQTDAAEQTLFGARQQYPENLVLLKELTQYFVRRVVALSATTRDVSAKPQMASEKPVRYQPPCRDAAARMKTAGLTDLCRAEDELRFASAATAPQGASAAAASRAPGDAERRRQHLSNAAEYFDKAAAAVRNQDQKLYAYDALARVYDRGNLNAPHKAEPAVRQLIALSPGSTEPVIRLAALQEDQKQIDLAEMTLIGARQQFGADVDVLKAMSRFYARLATAVSTAHSRAEREHERVPPPGQPDENGFYMVGSNVPPPKALDKPPSDYPADAKTVGIDGVVIVEVWIDATGRVANARVIRGIPMLEEAALSAVRTWRFEPAVVDGRAVPIRMIITQNFTVTR